MRLTHIIGTRHNCTDGRAQGGRNSGLEGGGTNQKTQCTQTRSLSRSLNRASHTPQAAKKAKRVEELEKLIKLVHIEEAAVRPPAPSDDPQTLRELENRLDKAVIKTQEAQFIGKTYKQITDKLQQDRLSYDGRITTLEQSIALRKQEIARLEVCVCHEHLYFSR